jgi:limonene-1,2-epoxide hydrolase
MSESEVLIRSFCDAWARRDAHELLGFFTEDAVYHNMPMAPVQGHDGIRSVMDLFLPGSEEIEFKVLAMASGSGDPASDTVFTERVDRFVMGGKKIELPVAGVFEVRDGKIAAWRDYFDMAAFTNQSA